MLSMNQLHSHHNHNNHNSCSSHLASNPATPSNCPLLNASDLSNRKRVSKACLECKKRHCRCDHQRPCGRCAKLGLQCVDAPTCKRGPPKGTCYKKRKRSASDEDQQQQQEQSSNKKISTITTTSGKRRGATVGTTSPTATTVVASTTPAVEVATGAGVTLHEPSFKKRRIDTGITSIPSYMETPMLHHYHQQQQQVSFSHPLILPDNNLLPAVAALQSCTMNPLAYMEQPQHPFLDIKQEEPSYIDFDPCIESMMVPPLPFFDAPPATTTTTTILQPKIEFSPQSPSPYQQHPFFQQFQPSPSHALKFSDLPDIEDLTVGMCMNSSCSANHNNTCMISEYDLASSVAEEDVGLTNFFDGNLSSNDSGSCLEPAQDSSNSLSFDLDVFDLIGNVTLDCNNNNNQSTTTTSQQQPQFDEDNFLLS